MLSSFNNTKLMEYFIFFSKLLPSCEFYSIKKAKQDSINFVNRSANVTSVSGAAFHVATLVMNGRLVYEYRTLIVSVLEVVY